MRWMLTIILFGPVASVAPAPQERVVSEARTAERVVGLLDLPEVFGDSTCERFQPKSIPFYARPSKEQPPAGRIEARETQETKSAECFQPRVMVQQAVDSPAQELPTEESGYEVQAAVVYERSGSWFRIAFQQSSAWIERENTAGYFAYPEGLTGDDHLTYLRKAWDGKIWSAPGQGPSASAPGNWMLHRDENLPIRVLATRIVNGEVWIRLHFETGEVCGEKLENVTPLEGWLPAYRPGGATSVWFYSRGC